MLFYLSTIDLIIVICSVSLLFIKFHSWRVYGKVNGQKVDYILP